MSPTPKNDGLRQWWWNSQLTSKQCSKPPRTWFMIAPKWQTCCQTFVDSGMTIICAKLVKGVWCVIGFVTLYSLGYKTWLPAKACPNLEQNQLFLSAEQYFFFGLHLPNQRGASFDFHYQLLGGPCTRYSMVVHGQLHGNYIILGFAVVLSRIPKIIRLGSFNH